MSDEQKQMPQSQTPAAAAAAQAQQAKQSKGFEELNKELAKVVGKKGTSAAAPEEAAQVKSPAAKKRAPAKKVKQIVVSSRRKTAFARATLAKGSGRITVNNFDIYAMENRYLKEAMLEPVNLSRLTREVANGSDISVNVSGGGASGQAQAARSAIAKAISQASKTDAIRKTYLDYDRSLVVDDVRQVEPKKYKGPKARARFQKSYR